MTIQPGSSIGPYSVLAKLGEGGMGQVYRARDTRLARDVALKILPDTFATDPDRVARFQREAQLLAALSHPNIAGIYGLEDSGPAKVLVMEFVEGESLDERLKRGPLSLDDAMSVATQIGDALGAAHDRGIVHRDLKPANVMLTPDGGVKVLDFGLAKFVEREPVASSQTMSPTLSMQATLAGTILGTAPYMSPEQARGRTVDKRTDVWAFGCVVFEMLTGTRAFGGEDTTETIAMIVKGDPDWAAIPDTVPTNVVSMIEGCLAKNPKERFADIAVPLYLLTTRPDAPLTSPAPATPTPPLWKRLVPIGAAAVVAALFTGAAAWFTRAPVPAPVVTRFAISLPAGQAFSNRGRAVMGISPDGSSIAYVANDRLYLRSMSEADPHPIPGASDVQGTLISPTFSPDGREVAFYTVSDSTLKRVGLSGGSTVKIATMGAPLGLRWDEEGFLFGLFGKGIFRVPPNGGELRQLAPADATDDVPSTPQSLPGGRGLLYSRRRVDESWDSGTVVVRTPAGETKTLIRNGSDGRYDGAGHLLYTVGGVVMAVPFDLDRLEVSGTPVPAIEGVMHQLSGQVSGSTQYSLATNGTVAYVPGPARLAGEGEQVLAIFDEKGEMSPLEIPPATYRSPRVSPDAHNVAFETGSDADANVWVQDITSKTAGRRLTFGGSNRAPIWSPDNQWIAFQSDREGDAGIFRQRADGSGVAERLTKSEMGVRHWPQSWSPDGSYLLFSVERDKHFELHVLSLKNRTTSRFSDVTSIVNLESAFSPDGRWIVYQRNDKFEVAGLTCFLEPFPATGAKYMIPVDLIAGHPVWSRSGDRLYFNTSSTTSHVVEVKTTPTVSFSPPRLVPRKGRLELNPVSNRRSVDPLPDGRLLGLTNPSLSGRESADGEEIIVVLNWLQMLNTKMVR